jgi:hypothetical protein
MPMPVTASTTAGSPRQKVSKFVLVSARKSRGADHWDKDDYDVRLGDVERSSSWPHHAPLAGTRGTAVVLDDNRAG